MAYKAFRGVLLAGVALALVHCGDDGGTKVVDSGEAGAGGEAAPASGGSGDPGDTAGAPTNSGGMPGGAGEPSIAAGTGGAPSTPNSGMPSTSGAPGESGAAGEPGMAGGPSCTPSECCAVDEPTCDSGWDTQCTMSGTYQACCDPSSGVRKSCGYGGGGVDHDANVCINDCTGKSYGVNTCVCLGYQDPACDTDWTAGCSQQGKVYCSDQATGYRLSCIDIDQYSRTIDVECVCDPDAVISGRRR